jgi:hypothetical protein
MKSFRLLLAGVLFVCSACQRDPSTTGADAAAATRPPASVTVAELQGLRWLEGTWRGTGVEQAPFYEGYRFLNDSTLQALYYADSTLTQVSDSSRIVLAKGHLISGGAQARWVATEIDSFHVHFEPQAGVQNSFTWTYESPSAWTATLRWTEDGQPMQRVYQMQRLGS